MTLLVLGESGQVARHLKALHSDALFWGRATLDMNDTARLERAIREAAPTVIVNAAAYTAVDKAESDASSAWRLNAEAPAAVARAAELLGVPLIHFSTDYVFDGEDPAEYEPDAPTRPLSVYGKSKLGGELAVASHCRRHWILRTSWVFSRYEPNFVRTMLRLAAERPALRIVDDQIGRPTYAGDLAAAASRLISTLGTGREPPWGIHHAVGGEVVSWYGFAAAIFERARNAGLIERIPSLEPIRTDQYPLPARRPLRAVLAPSIALRQLDQDLFDWRRGLDSTLAGIDQARKTS